MDCRDAQFFLRFRRPGSPGAGDLAPEDAAALDRHLAGCPNCAASARTSAAVDAAIGTAMRAVEVPASLRARLIASTSAERGTVLRRRAYRYAALAASLFLVVGLAAGIFTANRPHPDTYELAMKADALERVMRFEAPVAFGQVNPEQAAANEAAVRKWLKAEQLPENLPGDLKNLDFGLLLSHHWEEVQGRQTPVLLFRGRDQGFAKVYAFRATQFNLKNVSGVSNSNCQVGVYPTDHALGVTFVVVYTGHTLEPFLRGRGTGGPLT
jgi:anti-sigma factor RsiW